MVTALPAPRPMKARPKLTADTAVEYLDWVCEHLGQMSAEVVGRHMQAAELVIRTRMGDAQAKATQHTLVEQGVLPVTPPTV